MRIIRAALLAGALFAFLGGAMPLHAAEEEVAPVLEESAPTSDAETWLGVVRRIVSDTERTAPTGARVRAQELEIEIAEGPQAGQRITLTYEAAPLAVGDRVFLAHLVGADGGDIYAIEDRDRRMPLAWVIAAFVAVVLLFGRGQGARALVTLAVSIALLFVLLIPMLLRGYPPAWVAAAYAALVLLLALPLTHGFRRETVAALIGTIGAVAATVLLASLAVRLTGLTGLAEEVTLYLDIEYGGRLDLRGLLLGGIIVGVLGVLDDVAVTQAAAVEEIAAAGPSLSRREVFRRAMRVGREHVGALVNTLALAYIGAALPILLLVSGTPVGVTRMLNRELFAAEIVRTVVGSIGVIMAVPLTTWAAVWLRYRRSEPVQA